MNYCFLCFLAALLYLPEAGTQAQVIIFIPGKTTPYFSLATVATLAGAADRKGPTDGLGDAAEFARPMGVAATAAGTVYVADTDGHTIRKITSAGVVTTVAGAAGRKGSTDGVGSAARFYHPVGVAVDAGGTLYLTDADNHTIRKITSAGDVSTVAGTPGSKGSADGPGATARFNLPSGVAVDATGTLYVADTFNHTIRKITPAGVVTTWAGVAGHKGSTDGPGAVARFYHPAAVAIDAQGALYVADNGNQTIRKITPAGMVTTLAGTAGRSGSADGEGASARFHFPVGVAVDARGNVYVADYLNATIRQITATGRVSTLAGTVLHSGHSDGPGPEARFDGPASIAVDADGTLYVTDGTTIRIIK